MNPKREGFVEDTKQEAEIIEPRGKTRAMPPPEIEPSPAEQPQLMEDEWPIVVKLIYRPIRNNRGEDIKEVSLREPRAGDINRYGNPIRVNQDGDVLIDERKMTYMIAALSGVLPPFIEEMDTRDWNSCAYRLRRFFLPDPAAW
ncbi:phage tail assembly protein [Bradyrhizobium zhanjiangense]|uniref:phage tail assembly protein n=1 Tax=Bradyrhizobium zhanjiangense TaxID=1325107 RepID=UPI001008EF14|nr:phage tail assembly protein [Bradyrhizobium zhanjiangense]